jgi:hypothetical protein
MGKAEVTVECFDLSADFSFAVPRWSNVRPPHPENRSIAFGFIAAVDYTDDSVSCRDSVLLTKLVE